MSRKVFTAGEVLAAADVNSFLMDQTVMSFAGTAARGSAIPSPVEGMVTYSEADDLLEFYNGSAYVGVNRNLQARNRVMSATNAFNNQTSYADFPISADKTALDMTFVKKRASSSLLVTIDCQLTFNAGASQIKTIALSIGGTDYAITNTRQGDAVRYMYLSGSRLISGIAAGSLAVKPRFATAGASQDFFESGLIFSYSVEEIF